MTAQRMTWEFFVAQLRRLAFLPGYERMEREHWAEWYGMLAGYYPHELTHAIGEFLRRESSRFFPAPGVLIEIMGRERTALGRSWDEVAPALAAREAAGGARAIAPPPVAAVDRGEDVLRGIPGATDIGRIDHG